MSITNDIILEQPIIEIVPIQVEMPIDTGVDMNMQNQSIEIEMPQEINMTVETTVSSTLDIEIPDMASLTPLDEIQEMTEIVEIEMPEIVEVPEIESVEMEQPEELNSSTMEEDLVEINDEMVENVDEVVEDVAENKENNNNEAEETETNDGGDEKSQLSEPEEKGTEGEDKTKVVKKSKSKDDKKSKKNDVKKSTVKKSEPKSKTKTVVQKPKTESSPSVLSVDSLGIMVLPSAYLQVLSDTLKIVETVSITQDMIYEQNTYDLVQSTFESSFGGDSADRFDSLLGVQPSYQSPTYRRIGQ